MRRIKRTTHMLEGDREAAVAVATLGGQLRAARVRRRLRLVDLATRVGLSPARLSGVERGDGGGLPLRAWYRLGIAVGQPFAARISPPVAADRLDDAGHLEMQEWLLGLARRRRWPSRGWEVPTKPLDPRRSVDILVLIADTVVLFECWNTIRDFGAAVRSTNRKLAEARALAVALGTGRVAACWLVRPTAANRSIVRAYPELVRARFGASRPWTAALAGLRPPPDSLGFVWLDPRTGATSLRLEPGLG
ncbi:MAG TPA: helix-turn-helix domain-containing protein [Candidatus Limnocylindrales bacterium]